MFHLVSYKLEATSPKKKSKDVDDVLQLRVDVYDPLLSPILSRVRIF